MSNSRLSPYLYFGLSWFIPGLGHYLLKKKIKAIVFFGGIFTLVILGILMKGEIGSLYSSQPIHILEFLGGLGNGIFYFIFKLTGWGVGDLGSPTFHYGTTYIGVAGFLNLLIAMKAFGLAKEKKDV